METDRADALQALQPAHSDALRFLELDSLPLVICEQVHGAAVASIPLPLRTSRPFFAGADALITNQPEILLGIYVADCCAVYLVDPEAQAIGLVHSGAKGTRLGIVPKTIRALQSQFNADPSRLIAVLSPCIRPPWYEVDFASEIRSQCREEGLQHVFDSEVCTAAHPELFYSYRRERGKTGRMLALLCLSSSPR